jgi:RimJ/RimL family protein N-acetyltransferase
VDPSALIEVMARSAATPVMGYTGGSAPAVGSPPGSAAVLARENGTCVGVAAASWVWDADDVAEVVLFMDRTRSRAGVGLEALFLFGDELFGNGIQRVLMRVLAINAPVLSLMRHVGKAPDAYLREHHFLGGRFVGEYVFSWSPIDWARTLEARPQWFYLRSQAATAAALV